MSLSRITFILILFGQWLYLSAVGVYLNYLMLGIALIIGITIPINRKSSTGACVVVAFYLGVNILINNGIINGQAINLFLWITLTPIAFNCLKKLPCEYGTRIFLTSLGFASIYLTFDTILRFIEPSTPTATLQFIATSASDDYFYKYKFGGLMFSESNSFGVIALAGYIASRVVQSKGYRSYLPFLFFILIVLSLSRAAIITMLILESFYLIKSKIRSIPFTIFLSYCVAINLLLFLTSSILSPFIGGSGESKIEFLSIAWHLLHQFDIVELLFGIGLGQSINVTGLYLHNFFLLLLSETGVIGTIAILYLFWFTFNRRFLRPALISLPLLGLSYFFMLGAPAIFIAPLIAAVIPAKGRCQIRTRATTSYARMID